METRYDRSGLKTRRKYYFGWFLLDRGQIEGLDMGGRLRPVFRVLETAADE